MSIGIKVRGNFDNTEKFLKRMIGKEQYKNLERLAERGVNALASVTPKETGETAASWSYKIGIDDNGTVSIAFINDNKTKTGIPIVILLEYGHSTRNGGYVKGKRFIKPAIQPIMDEIANSVWLEVCK